MNQYENVKKDGEAPGTKGDTVKHLDKATVMDRARKMAVREAYMNAFSKVMIIVLSTGKATATFQEPPPDHFSVSKDDMAEAYKREDVDAEFSHEFGEAQDRPWVQ